MPGSEVLERLEDEGVVTKEAHPLFLPQYTVRGVIIAAFVGIAVYLYQQGQLFNAHALAVLGMVASYLLGVLGRVIVGWLPSGKGIGLNWLNDAKAIAVLLVTGVTAGFYFADQAKLLPVQVQHFTLGLTLFYFGSR